MISQQQIVQINQSTTLSKKGVSKTPLIDSILEGTKETKQVVDKYPDFTQMIHYPDGNIRVLPFSFAVKKFLEDKKDSLTYFTTTELDMKSKELNIYIIPKVESA